MSLTRPAWLDRIKSAVKKTFQRAAHTPADFPLISSTKPAVKIRKPRHSSAMTLNDWCHAFNVRNGWIIPAKSARSIFLKARGVRPGHSGLKVKALHNEILRQQKRAKQVLGAELGERYNRVQASGVR